MSKFEKSLVQAEIRESQPKQGEPKTIVRIAFRPQASANISGQIDIEKSNWATFANELQALADWIRQAPPPS